MTSVKPFKQENQWYNLYKKQETLINHNNEQIKLEKLTDLAMLLTGLILQNENKWQ